MASSGTKQRFVKGVVAAGANQILTLVQMLVNVPLFFHFWGPKTYGEWLLLSTLPTYLQISDFSLGNAASTEMTMLVAAGKKAEAKKVYQSAWILISSFSMTLLVIFVSLAWLLPTERILQVPDLGHRYAAIVVSLLVGQIIVLQQGGIFSGAYRCDGLYAMGTWVSLWMRLAEVVTTITVLVLHGNMIVLAGSVLATRVCSLTANYIHQTHVVPWLRLGFSQWDWAAVKPTLSPAFAFNAFPLGYVMNMQGVLYVIGFLMGPVAVAAFQTARTLSRFVFQVSTALSNNLVVELSRAFGEENLQVAKTIHRRVCQVAVWMCLVGSLVLAVAGPTIYNVWTSHKTPLNVPMFYVLLLVATVNSLWNCSYAVPVSVNRHQRIAVEYLIVMTLGTVLSLFLGRALGLLGVAVALVVAEVAMNLFTLRQSLPMVSDQVRPFIRTVFSPPIGWVYSRARSLL